jgi:hypothetical protein
MPNLPYDPDLKEAMEKIKAILDEHQIAGEIILASRSHVEFLHHFPKWSIAQLNKERNGIDIRSMREDFESQEQQHRDTEDSVSIICEIRDMAAQTFMIFDNVVKELENHMEIDHTPFNNFTPHFEN